MKQKSVDIPGYLDDDKANIDWLVKFRKEKKLLNRKGSVTKGRSSKVTRKNK